MTTSLTKALAGAKPAIISSAKTFLGWQATAGYGSCAGRAVQRVLVVHCKGCELRGLSPEAIAGWGPATMEDYFTTAADWGASAGVHVENFHSTDSAAVAEKLAAALAEAEAVDGVVINPGAWTAGGPDAERLLAALGELDAAGVPVVEAHISNPTARGVVSAFAPRVRGLVYGFGPESYSVALEGLRASSWVRRPA